MADIKYTKDHEWIKIENDIAIIGITKIRIPIMSPILFCRRRYVSSPTYSSWDRLS